MGSCNSCNFCNSECYRDALSTQIDAKWCRFTALILALVYIITGIVSMACGSVMVSYGGTSVSGESLPWMSGSPIWSGGVSLIAGIVGMCIFPKSIGIKHRIGLMWAFYGWNFGVMSTAIQDIVYNVNTNNRCSGKNLIDCSPNATELVDLSLVCIVMCAFTFLGIIGVFAWYGVIQYKASKLAKCNAGCKSSAQNDGYQPMEA